MKINRRFSVILLTLMMVFAFVFDISYASDLISPTQIQQVNIHVGDDAVSERNITWITKNQKESTIIIRNRDEIVFSEVLTGESNGKVFTYQSKVKNLKPNTYYTYEISNADSKIEGKFKTSKDKNEAGIIRFVISADPQVNDTNDAKGASSNFNYINEYSKKNPLDFLYIAGDHTNNHGNEFQWDLLLNGTGRYAEGNKEFFRSNTLLSTQGERDSKNLNKHINVPSLGTGNFSSMVYSSNFGNVKFIVLNTSPYPSTVEGLLKIEDFNKVIEFLKSEVKDAKENDMWVVVGFHKPLYTGASHMSDGDMRVYRKFLNPLFNEIGVDMVLSGHDHVYTRMFIDENGNKATNIIDKKDKIPVFTGKNGAPFHFVGGHGGGLKWHETTSYLTLEGDILLPGYQFADKNSAQENPSSAELKEQTFTVFEIDGDLAHVTAYNSKYYDNEDLQKRPYIYDEFYIKRYIPDLNVKFEIPENYSELARFKNKENNIKVKKDSVIEKENIPEVELAEGYVLVWEDIENPINKDTTFTANIKKKTYTVEFIVDEDKATLEGNSKIEVDYGDDLANIITPEVNVKEGYAFKGWDITLKGPAKENHVLTAILEKNSTEPVDSVEQEEPTSAEPVKPDPIKPIDPVKPTPVKPTRPNYNNSTTDEYNPMVAYFINNLGKDPISSTPSTRPVTKNTITKPVITDISGHWAENVITTVVEKGYMDLENGKFMPNVDATRLTYVKALAKMAGVNPKEYMNKTVFSDVVSGTTDAGYINWAYEKGIVKGTGDGKFEGMRKISRQEIATILNRYTDAMDIKLDKKEEKPFADDDKIADWAKADVKEARAKGIFSGKDNNMFDPMANITRAEVAQVIVNMDK